MANFDFLEFPIEASSIDIPNYTWFDNYLNNRTIIFNDEICENIVEKVILPLKKFEKDESNEPITLILSSSGGSVFDAFSLCSIIENYKKPLKVVNINYCMSMAFYILIAGNNNPNVSNYCYQYSFGLLHAGEISAGGESNSIKDFLNFTECMDDMIRDFVISHTKIDKETYLEHNRKQWYMCADEMKKLGVIQNIIGIDCEDY